MDEDADCCGLDVVSYDTWSYQNAGNNTPLQIDAQPNFDPITEVNYFFMSKVMEE